MERIKTEDLNGYIEASKGLERDYIDELIESRKRAVIRSYVALIFGVAGIGVALKAITSYKPEPFLLRVDNTTGAVDVLNIVNNSESTYGEAVDKYFLNLYVSSYESYDYYTIQKDYDTAILLSAPDVQKQFYKIYEGDNARDEVLGASTKIIAKINSITPDTDEGIAVVRFTTQVKHSTGAIEDSKHWVARVGYEYVNAPMSEADRRINPLGFQVTSYRVDPEVIN